MNGGSGEWLYGSHGKRPVTTTKLGIAAKRRVFKEFNEGATRAELAKKYGVGADRHRPRDQVRAGRKAVTPWFDISCTVCPNRDEVQATSMPFGHDVGPCTMGPPNPGEPHGHCPEECQGCLCSLGAPCNHCVEHPPCEGRMVRSMTAPSIGTGSSGEPFRPASGG